jgi:hypothetical protein
MINILSEKAMGSFTLTMIRNYGEIITARIRYISPRTFARDMQFKDLICTIRIMF